MRAHVPINRRLEALSARHEVEPGEQPLGLFEHGAVGDVLEGWHQPAGRGEPPRLKVGKGAHLPKGGSVRAVPRSSQAVAGDGAAGAAADRRAARRGACPEDARRVL